MLQKKRVNKRHNKNKHSAAPIASIYASDSKMISKIEKMNEIEENSDNLEISNIKHI